MSDLFYYVNKKKHVEDFQCKHKVPVNKKNKISVRISSRNGVCRSFSTGTNSHAVSAV